MAQVSEKDLSEYIKRSHFEKVYLFYGEERYLTRLYAEKISQKAVKQFRELNVHKFDQNASIDDIMLSAQTVPMMSDRSVVSVCDFRFSSLSKADSDRLIEFIKHLSSTCILIFWYDKAEFDVKKNKAFLDAVSHAGQTVSFGKKDAAQLAGILCSVAAKRGVSMQPTVAKHILSLCSNDLENLISETNKVCDYVGKRAVTVKDVDEIVSVSNEVSIYHLSTHILNHDADAAFAVLQTLFDAKTDAGYMMRTLAGAFVDVYRVKAAETEGVRPSAIGADFKYANRAFVLDKTARSARRISKRAARQAISIVHDYTMKIKRCEGNDRIHVETAVLQLLRVCGR